MYTKSVTCRLIAFHSRHGTHTQERYDDVASVMAQASEMNRKDDRGWQYTVQVVWP